MNTLWVGQAQKKEQRARLAIVRNKSLYDNAGTKQSCDLNETKKMIFGML